jgi:hypothetical protein
MPKNTTRATFTIDKQLWNETQQLLDDLGYPDVTMSRYLSQAVEKLNLQLEHSDHAFLSHLL